MKISIFTFCDFAQIYGEKICIMGAMDQIVIPHIPAMKSGFIVARIHFEREDEGTHTFVSAITDADGKAIVTVASKPTIVKRFEDAPQQNEMKFFYKFDFVHLQIQKYGEYTLELRDNGNVCASVPMMVYLAKPNQPH